MTPCLIITQQAAPLLVPDAGYWPLARSHALRLDAKRASVLRIARGRVWATVDGPHQGAPNDQGDLALSAGDRLAVAAGQRLVIEPLDRAGAEPVYFSFDPATRSATRSPDRAAPDACAAATRWQATVLLPARQLAASSVQALRALLGLPWGLASYAEFLVAGRGRVLGPYESNMP